LCSGNRTLPSTLSECKTWSVNMTEEQELDKSKKKALKTAFELRIVNIRNRVNKPRNI